MKCTKCGRELEENAFAAYCRFVDREGKQPLCLLCTCEKLGCTLDFLSARIDFLRRNGCTWFT